VSTPSRTPSDTLTPSPSLDLLREVARTDDGAAPADLSGRSVGRYRLVRLLGAGGMGVVYEAEDAALGRRVAVKLLRGGSGSGERERRFLREARLASAVNHPSVATVYDVGVEEGLGAFIAMELCEGTSLRRHAGGSPLAPNEVARIGGEIARALEAAHSRGVIHRDLKPDNVMILPSGAVKVLDFGVAKSLGDGDVADARSAAAVAAPGEHATMEGVVLGTPSYMSPEQARGETVDARSDVFALGLVLFELATGARPSSSPTEERASADGRRSPAPLAHAVDARVPVRLSRAIARCLEAEPSLRWESAAAVAVALDGAATSRPRVPRAAVGALALGAVAVAALVASRGARAPADVRPVVEPSAPARVAAASAPPSELRVEGAVASPPVASAAPAAPSSAKASVAVVAPSAARLVGSSRASSSSSVAPSAAASARARPPRDPLDEQK